MQTFCDVTYWLIVFLIVAAFANKAELVLGLLLWSWAWGSVHKCAGSCMWAGQTLWVSPASSWSSHGPPRCLSGLKWFIYQFTQSTDEALLAEMRCEGTVVNIYLQVKLPWWMPTLLSVLGRVQALCSALPLVLQAADKRSDE